MRAAITIIGLAIGLAATQVPMLAVGQAVDSTGTLGTGSVTTGTLGGGAISRSEGERNFALLRQNGRYSCARRKTCGVMISCEEAFYHLLVCSNGRLDGDGLGRPCERLCGDERGEALA